jgi:nitroreductase
VIGDIEERPNSARENNLAVRSMGAAERVVLVFWAVPSRSAAQYGERGPDLFALQDASIATSFAWIQAVALGLGACWVGSFDDDAVNEIFRGKIGRDWRPIALLSIGYPAE